MLLAQGFPMVFGSNHVFAMNFRHVQKSIQRSKSSVQEPILEPKVLLLGVQNGQFFNYFLIISQNGESIPR